MACKVLNVTDKFLHGQNSPEEEDRINKNPVSFISVNVLRSKIKRLREIDILKNLDHVSFSPRISLLLTTKPNIVRIEKVYQSPETL
jgi:hypothetical protein